MVAASAPEIVAALIKKAKSGHVHSGVGLLRLVVAPLRETADPIEIDIAKISNPSEAAEAMGVVIMAATAGKVSPDAARDVVAMIGVLGKQIESTDLERRLSAIESAIKASGQ
jgi:hypothetical protein